MRFFQLNQTIRSSISPLSVGIIGAGQMSEVHLWAFSQNPLVRLVALSDLDSERLLQRKTEWKVQKTYRDYHKLLQDQDIKVVDIILPHYLHAGCVSEALRAGKIVICEKPLGIRSSDFSQITRALKSSGKKVYVKHYLRSSFLHTRLYNLIQEGVLGKVYLVQCDYATNSTDEILNAKSWKRRTKEAGGGVWQDVGIHAVDLLYRLFGKPKVVWASMQKSGTKLVAKAEDIVAVYLEFPNKVLASIVCTSLDTSSAGPGWRKTFWGTMGTATIEDFGKDRQRLCLYKNRKLVFRQEEKGWWNKTNFRALEEIISAIYKDQPSPVTVDDARAIWEIIDSAYLANKVHKNVYLDRIHQ